MTFQEIQKGVIIKFNGKLAVKVSSTELLIAGEETLIEIDPTKEIEYEETNESKN